MTVILIAAVWYLSLFTPPKTELDHIRFIDKWTHLVMYGTLTATLWFEHLRFIRKKPDLALCIVLYLAPVLMSGLLELLQEYCTDNRSGEWMDLAANAVGAAIGVVIGYGIGRRLIRK